MRVLFLNNPQPNQQERQYINNVNQHIIEEKPLVIYFYREGCPYCVQTSKEWPNIKQYIETKNKNLLVVEANCELYNLMQNVGEKPIRYPTIRFIHRNNVIPFTKEGPQRNAYTMAKWIDTVADPIITSSRRQSNSMDMNMPSQSNRLSSNLMDMNMPSQSNRLSSNLMDMNMPSQSNRLSPNSMDMNNIFDNIENESFDDVYTSTKYPPFSNKFIAENVGSSQGVSNRPNSSSSLASPFRENIQMNIYPIRSPRKKRKSLYKSKRRHSNKYSSRKSLYKKPSYKPRFLTTRKKKLRGKTQMY
jgi:hypothetical protein